VFNPLGEVVVRAQLTRNVPTDFLVIYEAWFPKNTFNVQNVVDDTSSDMGQMKTGAPGSAIHSQFVDIEITHAPASKGGITV